MSGFIAFLEVTLQLLGAPTRHCPPAEERRQESPCQVPRGVAGAHAAPSTHPSQTAASGTGCSCPLHPRAAGPRLPHPALVAPPSQREPRLRFTQSWLAFEPHRTLVLILFSPWQTYAKLPTLPCVFMSTSSSFCTCYYELLLTLQM